MHPLINAILADESSFDVGPDTLTPEAELVASPVSRERARSGKPRAHVWVQFPDSATGRLMRASDTLTVAITTSPIYQNSYLPPNHRFSETPWTFTANPISEAEGLALGDKLGRETLHTAFWSGQHVGFGAENDEDAGIDRGVDGLLFPFGVGNVSFHPTQAFLDVNPIFGHPLDAIQTGIYSVPGQKKPASMGPGTEVEVDRGRFAPYTANSRAIGLAIARGWARHIRNNHLTYTPPGGGGPYELCIPDGFAFDVEEFIDRRLFHQDAYAGGWQRLSDLRELFLARLPDGTPTTRATTEPIMYGPPDEDGEPTHWTLQDWWDDLVERGVWLGTTTLPSGENFGVPGSPLEELGREIDILSAAIVEYYLGETWVKAYEEEFGRTPRWAQYEGGFAKAGADAPASQLLYGRTRYPAVTMNYVRGWSFDDAAYGSAEALTTEERLTALRAHMALFDLTRPSIAEVPVPRDGGKAAASVGDDDDILAMLQCLRQEGGITEFIIWQNSTDLGHNRDVERFWPVWQRFLAWEAAQYEEGGSGNLFALMRGAMDDDGFATVTVLPEEPDAEDEAPLDPVHIDAGIAAHLFLKLLQDGLDAITGDEGRGNVVIVEAFGENPRANRPRRARIMAHSLRPVGRPSFPGSQDARIYEVAIGCFVDQNNASAKSTHAAAEVASLVRRALDTKGIEHADTTHILNVLSIEDGFAAPNDPKADTVTMVGVTCMVTRDVGASIRVQGGAA